MITEDKFLAFEEMKQSGLVVMTNSKAVSVATEGLITPEEVAEIRYNYDMYKVMYTKPEAQED